MLNAQCLMCGCQGWASNILITWNVKFIVRLCEYLSMIIWIEAVTISIPEKLKKKKKTSNNITKCHELLLIVSCDTVEMLYITLLEYSITWHFLHAYFFSVKNINEEFLIFDSLQFIPNFLTYTEYRQMEIKQKNPFLHIHGIDWSPDTDDNL